jgi:hypothetical protein
MADTKEQEQAYIAALLRERAGLVISEDEEALAAVDAELKRMGHKASAPQKRAEKRTAAE